MESPDMETTFDKITTRWPELVESNTGDITFYHQLYKLLRAEEGHEMAASMCHALLDASEKIGEGNLEDGVKSIMPMLQDVALYDWFRFAALYIVTRHGDLDSDATSKIWRSPVEAAHFREVVLPIADSAYEICASSVSPSSTGVLTPSESDCTLPNEEQIPSETADEMISPKIKCPTPRVGPEDTSPSTDTVGPEIIHQLIKGVKDLSQNLNDMNADHEKMQTQLMDNVHQKIDAIKADCHQQLEHVSATRQMMNETVEMIKDEIKILKEQHNSSNASSDTKQPAPPENAIASAPFESGNAECRNLRIQIYHAQLAACRDHTKAKPGARGDCCLSSIARVAGRDREAQLLGYMTLANKFRDKARGVTEYRQRNELTRQEELNLNDVLRLLREIAPK